MGEPFATPCGYGLLLTGMKDTIDRVIVDNDNNNDVFAGIAPLAAMVRVKSSFCVLVCGGVGLGSFTVELLYTWPQRSRWRPLRQTEIYVPVVVPGSGIVVVQFVSKRAVGYIEFYYYGVREG